MTFCFFSAQYLPTVGGVERYTHSLATQLIAKGHKAVVVTSSVKNSSQKEVDEGITVLRVPSLKLVGGRMPVALPFFAWNNIKKQLKELGVDFIVVQTRLYPLSILGAKFANKNRVPFIVLDHSTAHLVEGGLTGFLCGLYEHALMKKLVKYGATFYAVSKSCTKWLLHFGVKTDNVLYNAVDPAKLNALANMAIKKGVSGNFPFDEISGSEGENSGDKKKPCIAFSGRFIQEKGVIPLIKAFEEVKKTVPDAVLLLGGDGPQKAEILQNLPKGAHLLGMLPYEKNLALLKSADVYCLPTTFAEGFPTTVLEAAALNTAVITTPKGGSPELIVDDEHGIIIDELSTQTLAQALIKALSDDNWREIACKNAHNRLCEHFTWQSVSDKLIKIAEGDAL